ncbi:30674_t:CDS:1, partial [Racocetra persica]
NQDALQTVLREIANTFRDITARAAAAPRAPIHETNLVHVEPFFGTEEEDPLNGSNCPIELPIRIIGLLEERSR